MVWVQKRNKVEGRFLGDGTKWRSTKHLRRYIQCYMNENPRVAGWYSTGRDMVFVRALMFAVVAALPAMAGAQDIPATIPQVVLPAPDLGRYGATLVEPGLNARLSGPGPITAFVPRDAGTPAPGGPQWPSDPQEAAVAARALVVEGEWTPERLRTASAADNNRVVLSTDTGASLIVTATGAGRLIVVDHHGNTAGIVGPARRAGNGAVVVLERPLASR